MLAVELVRRGAARHVVDALPLSLVGKVLRREPLWGRS
jgi:hypothetical protein